MRDDKIDTANILQGEQIRLTAVSKEDLSAIARWYEDAGFARLFDATPVAPKNKSQWTKWLEEQQDADDGFIFAIRETNTGAIIGYLQLDGILWTHGNGWLGIGLGDRKNWGRGYGQEAVGLALRFAFHELNLHRIQLTVFSYNQRAIALYEKLGFVQEGVFREHIERDGRRYDMILYGLLRREWEIGAGK